mmetsp:Transcript_87677/g.173996  ORF Transcript_87677/g.173996 Transcript_87677/m.173996 type:complete len:824 (-) Transcript_87677:33-2504(-)
MNRIVPWRVSRGKSGSNGPRWEVLTQAGWAPFNNEINDLLLSAAKDGATSVEFGRGKFQYQVTFLGPKVAEQCNLRTQQTRQMRKLDACEDPTLNQPEPKNPNPRPRSLTQPPPTHRRDEERGFPSKSSAARSPKSNAQSVREELWCSMEGTRNCTAGRTLLCCVAQSAARQRWQVHWAHQWRDFDDDLQARLEKAARSKATEVFVSLGDQTYRIDLLQMVQVNVKTGRKRAVRCQLDAGGAAPTLNAPRDATCSVAWPVLSITRAMSGISLDFEPFRFQVFREGAWKNMASDQAASIIEHMGRGESVFDIEVRGFRYRIDMNDFTQKNLDSGKVRSIRQLEDAGIKPRMVEDSPPPEPEKLTVAVLESSFRTFSGEKSALGEAEVVARWLERATILTNETEEAEVLVRVATRRLFEQMTIAGTISGLTRTRCVSRDEWVHYWLLMPSASSHHAFDIIQEVLRKLVSNAGVNVLSHFLKLYQEADAESGGHGEITPAAMTKACTAHLHEFCPHGNMLSKVKSRKPLFTGAQRWMERREQGGFQGDEDQTFNYFEFVSEFIGRTKIEVWVYQYDISNGRAAWAAPVLLGQQMEGIWHTGIVVFGYEYWYGGGIFESTPEETPFGTATKKLFLGTTFCNRGELLEKLTREFCREYTPENYDILTHNCNNFTDDIAMFLMNVHIPDEVRMQPEQVVNSIMARALRPILNSWLGGFTESVAGMKECRAADQAREDAAWAALQPGSLVKLTRDGLPPVTAEILEKSEADCAVWWWEPTGHSGLGRFMEAVGVSKMQVTGLGCSTSRSTPRKVARLENTNNSDQSCCIA